MKKKFKKASVKSMTFKFTQQESEWLDSVVQKSGKDSYRSALFWLLEQYARGLIGEKSQGLDMEERLKLLNFQFQALIDRLNAASPGAGREAEKNANLKGAQLFDEHKR